MNELTTGHLVLYAVLIVVTTAVLDWVDEPASLARARIVASSWIRDQQGRRYEEMSLCLQCGHPTSAGRDLCSHHDSCHADDWATGNRIMCDFLHRRIVSPSRAEFFIGRLEAASRDR